MQLTECTHSNNVWRDKMASKELRTNSKQTSAMKITAVSQMHTLIESAKCVHMRSSLANIIFNSTGYTSIINHRHSLQHKLRHIHTWKVLKWLDTVGERPLFRVSNVCVCVHLKWLPVQDKTHAKLKVKHIHTNTMILFFLLSAHFVQLQSMPVIFNYQYL